MDPRVSKLCERAFATGLPVFMVNTNTGRPPEPAGFNLEVPVDDHERIEKVQEYVAGYINADWIESLGPQPPSAAAASLLQHSAIS